MSPETIVTLIAFGIAAAAWVGAFFYTLWEC